MTFDLSLDSCGQVDLALTQSKKLCKFFVEEGLISSGHVSVVLYDQYHTGLALDEILNLHGWIDRSTYHRILMRRYREQLEYFLNPASRQAEMTLCLNRVND